MSGFNRVTLMGHISSEIDVKVTESDVTRAKFHISVKRPNKPGVPDVYDVIPIIAWGDLADKVQKTLTKNMSILVKGRLSVYVYDSPEGVRSWLTQIDAREVLDLGDVADVKPDTKADTAFKPDTFEADALEETDFDFSAPESSKSPESKGFEDEIGKDIPF